MRQVITQGCPLPVDGGPCSTHLTTNKIDIPRAAPKDVVAQGTKELGRLPHEDRRHSDPERESSWQIEQQTQDVQT